MNPIQRKLLAAGLLFPARDRFGRGLSETGQGQEQEKKFIHAAM